ncbi:DUF4124 domain-containing protein [Metapseudomonas otitidis]|uniref:DUF4124 domain-containing protein n=1 Tax=Metapseudomonas otitidis TaxID=319939 RepID=UPI001F23BCD3|nr:DUF4124 domain-containing protein [Pseudomonas otitidis]
MHRMIFAGLVLALSTSAMAGQVYKWVDAQGVTHFGAQPPQGQDSTQVSTGKAEPKEPKASFENPYPVLNKAEEPAKAPAQAKPASEDEQKAIDEKVKKDVAKQEAERKEYCTQLRTNLAQMQNNPRLRVEDKGEVRRLTEEERQSRLKVTQKAIAENCQ